MRDAASFNSVRQSTGSPGSVPRSTDFESEDSGHGVTGRLGQALMIVSGAALAALAARQYSRRRSLADAEAQSLGRGRSGEYSGALRAHAEEDTGAAAPVQTAVTIGRPASEVYAFWRRLENLPRFMNNVESVTETGDGRSHWVAKGPLGFRVEWDAEVVEEEEGRLLSWRSLPGAQVHNAGTVHFEDAPGDRGTVVRVSFEYMAASGIGQAIGKVLKPITKQEVREDLRRLKMLLETEEIPTIDGQTHGTRSLIGRIHNPF